MKKIFLFAAVLSAFTFASCKKDRSCTCTSTTSTTSTVVTDWETSPTTTTSTTYSGSGTGVTIINDAKKKDAKKACIDSKSEDTDVDTDEGNTYNTSSGTWEDYVETTTDVTTNETTCDLK